VTGCDDWAVESIELLDASCEQVRFVCVYGRRVRVSNWQVCLLAYCPALVVATLVLWAVLVVAKKKEG